MFKDNDHYVGGIVDGVTFGYSKRLNGVSQFPENSLNLALYIDDALENVHENQLRLGNTINFQPADWVSPIQTHGNEVREVTIADRGKNIAALGDSLEGVDGVFTHDENVLLTMNYADCVPVYVYSRKNNFIGLAHAGWKGTSGRITQRLIESYDGELVDLAVLIGPAINHDAYEVDDRVIDKLRDVGLDDTCFTQTESGYQLDLKQLNKLQAMNIGIDESQIFVSDLGTEDTSQFFSYRVEGGKTGRAVAFIGRKSN
ncbi:peptidoglycan editing factor PgeF [Aliicoccus persicus]|uniref:Purine nucleoside phosphorylase n=1 Tax=Aliicoccus persicus TaxID=930138 RepID=A0A662Z2J9_9STAP|nr:peptidoglycan editing factor PgeF [Aliicoccus persicus]SEV80674.1 conserved hypothetical protein [Aliicoccus persicus]